MMRERLDSAYLQSDVVFTMSDLQQPASDGDHGQAAIDGLCRAAWAQGSATRHNGVVRLTICVPCASGSTGCPQPKVSSADTRDRWTSTVRNGQHAIPRSTRSRVWESAPAPKCR